MYTLFWDMHSGGGQKEKWSKIIIEAPEEEAKIIFYNRFGHNPDRVTCTCCGQDYSISEDNDLYELIDYHLGGRNFNVWLSDPEHMTPRDGPVLLIEEKDILEEERIGDLPMQGYVWVG